MSTKNTWEMVQCIQQSQEYIILSETSIESICIFEILPYNCQMYYLLCLIMEQ